MIIKVLRAIFCGNPFPVSGRYDISCEGGEAINDDHVYGIVDELAKADPDIIEDYCDKVAYGVSPYEDLAKALPLITTAVCNIDYSISDRTRIRNALKKVFFNVHLERTAQNNLFETIQRISNA